MDLLKKRISQILMVVILGMLILYAGFHINIHLPEEARMELNRFLGSKAEDTYLTGFAYCKDGSEKRLPAGRRGGDGTCASWQLCGRENHDRYRH